MLRVENGRARDAFAQGFRGSEKKSLRRIFYNGVDAAVVLPPAVLIPPLRDYSIVCSIATI